MRFADRFARWVDNARLDQLEQRRNVTMSLNDATKNGPAQPDTPRYQAPHIVPIGAAVELIQGTEAGENDDGLGAYFFDFGGYSPHSGLQTRPKE
jgi:hypothetical protein